ncbi:MAG: hypothetical protein ACRYFZ_02915 [Janthinobacterium lividum]
MGGQRAQGAVLLRRGPALTLIGTLSVRGLGGRQLLKQLLNKHSFARYVGRCLAPTLRRGDVLLLNNLPVHHLHGLREWLAKRAGRGGAVSAALLPRLFPQRAGRPVASSKPRCLLAPPVAMRP